MIDAPSTAACRGMRLEEGGYRREHQRAFPQRIEIAGEELRIIGSKSELLQTLVAASSGEIGGFWHSQFCTEMARPNADVSNELLETLADWSALLNHRKSADFPVPPCSP